MKLKCVLIFFSGMAISMMAMSFFNMPQKMFEMGSQMGSQMVSPSQNPKTICECKCN
jgi:hypothetical protein